jgi:hypothetical protein
MKWLCSAVVWLSLFAAWGQGTFVYDQQSSTDETPWSYGGGFNIQEATPSGQSFTPSLPTVNFIRLNLNDAAPTNGFGGTIFLNLRAGSMGGTIIGTAAPVTLTNAFTGTVNFIFASDVPLTTGGTYVFELVIQSGDLWNGAAGEYNYPGGTSLYQGLPLSGGDLWFREGVIVPEPSSAGLILLAAVLASVRRSRANGR